MSGAVAFGPGIRQTLLKRTLEYDKEGEPGARSSMEFILIHVIAAIELHPGTRDRFLREFARLEPEVHAEVGCIEYGAAVDLVSGVPGQVPIRPDVVTVVEKWSSIETLGAHGAAPHMQAYRERVRDFVIRVTLQVLAPVNAVPA